MQHVVNLRYMGTISENVHLIHDPSSPVTLCNISALYEGHRVMIPTEKKVKCVKCRKALEMVIRRQMDHLSAAGLEKTLDLIRAMRNGDILE